MNSQEKSNPKVTKSGEMVNTGADQTPIADGDAFELTLTVGYDG